MFALCSTLTALAEDTSSNTARPPEMTGEAPEGAPPEMPEGGLTTFEQRPYNAAKHRASAIASMDYVLVEPLLYQKGDAPV